MKNDPSVEIATAAIPATSLAALRLKLSALLDLCDDDIRADVPFMPDAKTRLALSIAADVIDLEDMGLLDVAS